MLCLQLTINVEEVNKKERENQQHVVCEHRVLYKSIADRFCSTKYRAWKSCATLVLISYVKKKLVSVLVQWSLPSDFIFCSRATFQFWSHIKTMFPFVTLELVVILLQALWENLIRSGEPLKYFRSSWFYCATKRTRVFFKTSWFEVTTRYWTVYNVRARWSLKMT